MIIAFLSALENSDKQGINLRRNPELLSLLESMKKIDPDFENYMRNNHTYLRYDFWNFLPFGQVHSQTITYQEVVGKWKQLQSQRPNLFKGLEKEYLLDDWDVKTGELLQSYSNLNIEESNLAAEVGRLAQQYQNNYQDLVSPNDGNYSRAIKETKAKVDKLHESFNVSSKEIFWDGLNGYQKTCERDKINEILSAEQLSCPYSAPEEPAVALSKQLQDISRVISSDFLNQNSKAPEKPKEEPFKVHDYAYKNINTLGSYCERDPKLADTVVIHHSGTRAEATPQDLHDLQVVSHENDRDAAGRADPWYMIGYNYVIQANYDESDTQEPKVYRGRPENVKGAHAGGYVNMSQVDPKVQELLKNAQFQCGWNEDGDAEHGIDKLSPNAVAQTQRQIQDGYVSANITSVGVLVTGNYAPDIIGNTLNIGGYPANGAVRYPTEGTLRASAKLICSMRSGNFPNLRKITDHNYIKIKKAMADGGLPNGTCCPGTVYYRMNRILELTKEECPEHNFALDISPEEYLCPFLKKL